MGLLTVLQRFRRGSFYSRDRYYYVAAATTTINARPRETSFEILGSMVSYISDVYSPVNITRANISTSALADDTFLLLRVHTSFNSEFGWMRSVSTAAD